MSKCHLCTICDGCVTCGYCTCRAAAVLVEGSGLPDASPPVEPDPSAIRAAEAPSVPQLQGDVLLGDYTPSVVLVGESVLPEAPVPHAPPSPAERPAETNPASTDGGVGCTPRPWEVEEGVALRPEVLWFAGLMEAELRQHDAKRGSRGWVHDLEEYGANDAMWGLCKRVRDEHAELLDAVEHTRGVDRILGEAADVANMAMMVADVACGCPPRLPAAPVPPTEPTPPASEVALAALLSALGATTPEQALETLDAVGRERDRQRTRADEWQAVAEKRQAEVEQLREEAADVRTLLGIPDGSAILDRVHDLVQEVRARREKANERPASEFGDVKYPWFSARVEQWPDDATAVEACERILTDYKATIAVLERAEVPGPKWAHPQSRMLADAVREVVACRTLALEARDRAQRELQECRASGARYPATAERIVVVDAQGARVFTESGPALPVVDMRTVGGDRAR